MSSISGLGPTASPFFEPQEAPPPANPDGTSGAFSLGNSRLVFVHSAASDATLLEELALSIGNGGGDPVQQLVAQLQQAFGGLLANSQQRSTLLAQNQSDEAQLATLEQKQTQLTTDLSDAQQKLAADIALNNQAAVITDRIDIANIQAQQVDNQKSIDTLNSQIASRTTKLGSLQSGFVAAFLPNISSLLRDLVGARTVVASRDATISTAVAGVIDDLKKIADLATQVDTGLRAGNDADVARHADSVAIDARVATPAQPVIDVAADIQFAPPAETVQAAAQIPAVQPNAATLTAPQAIAATDQQPLPPVLAAPAAGDDNEAQNEAAQEAADERAREIAAAEDNAAVDTARTQQQLVTASDVDTAQTATTITPVVQDAAQDAVTLASTTDLQQKALDADDVRAADDRATNDRTANDRAELDDRTTRTDAVENGQTQTLITQLDNLVRDLSRRLQQLGASPIVPVDNLASADLQGPGVGRLRLTV